MSTSTTLLYRPLSLLLSTASGALAGALFRKVWSRASGQNQTPTATDRDRGWPEILLAAAAEGATFAVVKAATDRAGAVGFQRLTGTWPGKH
jgi:uncharacterized protein DUF4235